MKINIHRGTHEIGGSLIELKTDDTRLVVDAGYPLFLNGLPIEDRVSKYPVEKLLELGVLPPIQGIYQWDKPSFAAVVISHAHIDHYGLLKYIHPQIPVYLSAGTLKLIELSQTFRICDSYPINSRKFEMYKTFNIGDFCIRPFLMDHSAFDAAAFEISADNCVIIYSGDFRGHGRKAVCLDSFIRQARKQSNVLLTEGTMMGRQGEDILTESELENSVIHAVKGFTGPVLFQSSSQNIDRLVSFYKAASSLDKIFVVDVYTANILFELRQLGNNLPYPSREYANIRVFFPYRLTRKIFDQIGESYACRFSAFHISRAELADKQNSIIMTARPSMRRDIEKCRLQNGLFIYSLWQGYRNTEYQIRFEDYLKSASFVLKFLHTSGHASVPDIEKLVTGLNPKKVVPIHTLNPDAFRSFSHKTSLKEDGVEFDAE